MDFLTWGRNPWGQRILTHISWDLFWAALFAGLMFLVAHASYMILSAHRKRTSAETDALEAANKDLPPMITRHSFMARMFPRAPGARIGRSARGRSAERLQSAVGEDAS